MKYTLKKNQIGYYEVFPKPSLDDLKTYCRDTYYWKDRNLGKYAHSLRLDCSNYLAAKDIQRYIEYREAAADLEFGRLLIAFVRI